MLKILRITGKSMFPDYQEGDFVIVTSLPAVLRRIKPGDIIVFKHAVHGQLIKRVQKFTPDNQVYVIGTNQNSLDSRRLGPIKRDNIQGKVIFRISR